jgi:hypothetical protein
MRSNIGARRAGEPAFTHVQDIGDAIKAALARDADLIIPRALFDELRARCDLPSELPPYIKIR